MSLNKTLPLWTLPLIVVGVLGITRPVTIAAAVIIAFFPLLVTMIRRPDRQSVLAAPLLLFVISALVGLTSAYNPLLGLPLVVTIIGSTLLFFAIIYSRNASKAAAKGLVFFSGFVAFYFVTQYYHIGYPTESGFMAAVARGISARLPNMAIYWMHPNAVGGLVSSTLLLNLALFWRARLPENRVWWGAVSLLQLYALLVSGSRGAFIALAIGAAIFAAFYLPKSTYRIAGLTMGLGVGLLAGVILFLQLTPPHMSEQTLGPLMETIGSRLTLYHNSFNLYKDYLFTGIGPGDTFTMVYSRYQLLIDVPFLYYAHNILLAVALGQGLLGLFAFIWLLVAFYWFVFNVERFSGKPAISPLFRAAWVGTTITVVHGFADAVQFSGDRWTMPVFFALLGISVASGRAFLKRQNALARVKLSPQARLVVVAAVIFLVVGTALIFRQTLLTAMHINRGALIQTFAELSPAIDSSEKQAKLSEAQAAFEAALRLDPQNGPAHRRLGTIALDAADFDAAVMHLEQAYQQEPDNQPTIKALAYAYMWSGNVDKAFALFEQVEFKARLLQELDYWRWQWGENEQYSLAGYTDEILTRLTSP